MDHILHMHLHHWKRGNKDIKQNPNSCCGVRFLYVTCTDKAQKVRIKLVSIDDMILIIMCRYR